MNTESGILRREKAPFLEAYLGTVVVRIGNHAKDVATGHCVLEEMSSLVRLDLIYTKKAIVADETVGKSKNWTL